MARSSRGVGVAACGAAPGEVAVELAGGCGALEHAASAAATTTRIALSRICAAADRLAPPVALLMWTILLEALAALALLVFIVWWTMFSGRTRGERRDDDEPDQR